MHYSIVFILCKMEFISEGGGGGRRIDKRKESTNKKVISHSHLEPFDELRR